MAAKQEAVAQKNKKEGETFLAENKKKDGVKTLPSGLQYKVIKSGNGKKPTSSDTVTTNYRGTLIDGTEFDSSYRRGQPTTFPVKSVIPGWTEALQLMEEGAKWQLFIPSNLAYGEQGAGRDIGPNATLIFEVELVSISELTGLMILVLQDSSVHQQVMMFSTPVGQEELSRISNKLNAGFANCSIEQASANLKKSVGHWIATILMPFLSNRWMMSPMNPLWTASGFYHDEGAFFFPWKCSPL
jgi:hypothetical protein